MPLYDFFKHLLNIPSINEDFNDHNQQNNEPESEEPQNHRSNYRNYEDTWRDESPNENMRNFNVFTDPLEMHRYFEHQMNEILKSFGGFFGPHALTPPESQFPGMEETPRFPSMEETPRSSNLRDRFLKPGYEYERDAKQPRRDQVLDDQLIHPGDLDELLKEKKTPFVPPKIRLFGHSMSSKIIRKPDGTIETHKTTRDHAGNEETVITRQMGDKQYTVRIRTDKEGRQEKHEDFVNIDEKELNEWNRIPTTPPPPQQQQEQENDDFNKLFPYFDKFFK